MSNAAIQSQSVNMGHALRGIWRRKSLIFSFLVLGSLVGGALLALVKPSYQSEAQVIIEDLSTPYEKLNAGQDVRSDLGMERIVTSQVSVLKSQDLAARVGEALHLQDNSEFNAKLKSVSFFKKVLINTGFTDDPAEIPAEQLVVKHLVTQATVYPVPESNVIGIKYQSYDGKTAADVANALADTFVLSTRETQAGSTNRARDWLGQQITDLRLKVSESEAKVEKYRSEAGLLKGAVNSTLNEQQITELNSQITLADAASSEATARVNEIKSLLKSKGSVDASSDVLGSPVIQSLRQQQSATSRKLSELSAVYLPNHPKMVAAMQELQGLDSQVRREALKVVDSLGGQAKVAAARAASLRSSLEKLKARQSTENLDDVKLKELERNAMADRTLLEAMLARFADANARQDLSLQPGYARVIQRAAVQSVPYFPKPGPIMLLTSFVGLGLGLGLAFLFEVMQSAARTSPPRLESYREEFVEAPQQIQKPIATLTPAPVPQKRTAPGFANSTPAPKAKVESSQNIMATVQSVVTQEEAKKLVDLSSSNSKSEIAITAEQLYRTYKSAIEGKSLKSLAFMTVGGQQHDASTSSIAAARVFAGHKLKVLLVDVSANNSEALIGLPTGPGLSDLVSGEADFTKVICRDPFSTAHFIRFGQKDEDGSHVAIVEKFPSIMSALKTIYDIVIVNAGEASQETPALVQHCNVACLLASSARQSDAVAASKFLEETGVQSSIFIGLNNGEINLAKTA